MNFAIQIPSFKDLSPERMHLLEVEVEAEMFYTENSYRDWDGQIQAKMIRKESKMRREG